jgi:hypothetical protein
MVIQAYLDSNKDDLNKFNTFHEAISKVFFGSNFGPMKLLELVLVWFQVMRLVLGHQTFSFKF